VATIRTAIQMHDGMSGAIKSINNAMNIIINSFESLQDVSSNAIDTNSIQAARQELARAETAFNDVENGIREADAAQQQLNDEIRNGQSAADGLASNIKRVVGAFIGIAAIKKGVSAIGDWLGLADVQIASEKQLATVMGNMGATRDEFESIKKAASEVQLNTTFGDEVLLGGASELATYLKSGDAIEAMMGTLADYAAGMGDAEVDKSAMVEYATQLGKALYGTYDGLRKKGFEVSDSQKKIIENGTEMERVAVISDIIAQSWDGLAESLANTPEGQILQMKNTWGDIKETIGSQLYPAVLKFFGTLNSNMPHAESMMIGFATAAAVVMEVLGHILNVATSVSSFFMDNWGWIAPIMWGIVAALVAYNAISLITSAIMSAQAMIAGIKATATAAEAGATFMATVAQHGLNAALYACPITWIVLLIIALIAVFYGAVAAVNHFAGTSVSATGVIAGAFMVALAFIGNLFVGFYNLVIDVIAAIWNFIAGFAEFFANVFNDPIGSILRLFASMADSILGILQGIAKLIDAVFGSNLADSVKGWRSSLEGMVTDLVGEAEIKIPRMDTSSLYLDRFNYGDAYDAGYDFGKGVEEKFDFSNLLGSGDIGDYSDQMKFMSDMADTAENTGAMKDTMEASTEELKYLRDMAEKEAVNRYTTAEIKVEMKNDMNINSELDLDGVVAHLEEKVYETMVVAAEGVHG